MAAPSRSVSVAIGTDGGRGGADADGHDRVLQMILEAAVAIIDDSGIKAVTVRSIARRTHYSSSTIGYHVSPIERFHTTLWQNIGADLIAHAMGLRTDAAQDWAASAACRAAAWSDRYPARAAFLSVHHPDPGRDIRWDVFLGASGGVDLKDHEDVLQYIVRRMQAALEYLTSAPDRALAESIFADELRHALVWTKSIGARFEF